MSIALIISFTMAPVNAEIYYAASKLAILKVDVLWKIVRHNDLRDFDKG